jgi:hypothetical protein
MHCSIPALVALPKAWRDKNHTGREMNSCEHQIIVVGIPI